MSPTSTSSRTGSHPVQVDIVVNNHNYGRFLAEAVDSALAQTYSDVKVIVVDDGSTDDSRVVLHRYEQTVELVLKENGGQASALNRGFDRCSGDAVIFLDADDVLRPDAAALVAEVFAADPGVAKVQYRMEVIDEDGAPTGVVKPSRHLPLPQGDVSRAELTFPFDLVWLATSANAFSVPALRRLMPIPEREFADFPDRYLVHLSTLLGPIASLDAVGASYRVHGVNRYEPQTARLDLVHLRRTIAYSAATSRALIRLADELERPHGRPLSVSDLANRIVSLKLGRETHPIPTDRVWTLAVDGTRAALRRFDISWPLKLLAVSWFAIVAVAPRPAVGPIAELFLFPERRETLNRVLGRLHRPWSRSDSP